MTLLDWWVPDEPLAPGENELLGVLANLKVSTYRALGGRLVATDRRLIYRPNRVDRALGARMWQVALRDVREIGRAARTWNPFDGGLRSRLRIVTSDGREHLFVVNGLATLIEQLRVITAG